MTITSFPDADPGSLRGRPGGRSARAHRPGGRGGPSRAARSATGDSVIFYDIRGEREVELTESLIDPAFTHFPAKPSRSQFRHPHRVLAVPGRQGRFPARGASQEHPDRGPLAAGFRVVKIAESEKAIHVAYFFNGKSETVFPGEERVVVPSPQTGRLRLRPGDERRGRRRRGRKGAGRGTAPSSSSPTWPTSMSSATSRTRGPCSRPSRPWTGPSAGSSEAARREKAVLVVTADHGTVEEWLYPDGTVNTGHTKNPVPFILADLSGRARRRPPDCARPESWPTSPRPSSRLAGIAVPPEMTGRSLVEGPDVPAGARPEDHAPHPRRLGPARGRCSGT